MHPSLRLALQTLIGLAVACAAATVRAADIVETIAKVKPSIVGVGTFMPARAPAFEVRGTGFVVGNGTLVATNAHVIAVTLDAEKRETLAIAIPGENGSAMVRPARVVGRGSDFDVAVLAIDGAPLPALTLGTTGSVREGQTVHFTGFPIGAALGMVPATHRALVSALAPLALPQSNAARLDPKLVRRLASGNVRVIQLDGTAYPGNSGSPLYDDQGVVVGILNATFVKGSREAALSQPSGISYAVPVEFLLELLR